MSSNILQKLARSNFWQIYYNRAKDLGTLQLFENNKDLSKVQVEFLYMLELYHILFQDLNNGENYLTEEVLEDELRTEAYLLYRRINRKNKNIKPNKSIIDNTSEGSLIFKRKKRK